MKSVPLWPYAHRRLFDQQAGIWTDLWALDRTIFEIRSARALFGGYFGNSTEVLQQMVQTLGKLPEPWWNAWEHRHTYFDDQGKPKKTRKDDIKLAVEYPLVKQIEDIGTEDEEDGDEEGEEAGRALHSKESRLNASTRTKLTNEKVGLLKYLLSEIFKYTPNERLTAKNIINHSLFCQ